MKNLLLGFGLILAFNGNASTPGSLFPIKPLSVSAFEFLHGHKQGQGFALQWRLANNAGVEKYEIVSTYEDPYDVYSNWTLEGDVTDSKKGVIKFVDTTVLPGEVSYRVRAVFNNGRPSEVSEIYITRIE